MSDAVDCIFCSIVAGDIPGDVVHTTERTVAFRDLHPQAPTHVLVVPKEHYENGAELAAADPVTTAELLTAAKAVAEADGHDSYRMVFNTGADAGQTVFHAHLHVLAGPMTGLPGMIRRLNESGKLRLSLAGLVAVACVVAGFIAMDDHDPARAKSVTSTSGEKVVLSHDDTTPVSTEPVKSKKLRAGEQRTTLQIPTAYKPKSPTGNGTDDYRCFLLDPKLPEDAWLTGTQILPGNPEIVHHVILFRVTDEQVADAEAEDAASPEEGWTCFGGMGLEGEFNNVDDAAWLGAWAPGGRETVARKGYGASLDQGTKIVMQVHYNLLLGDGADQSATQIRWTPKAGSDVRGVHTTLLPAPVEMPCRSEHALGPLCDREASVQDAKNRFGDGAGQLANLLHLLCGTNVYPTDTTSCTRTIPRAMTVLGAAGHMHLLGQWLKIEANPGTPDASEVLDIPLWNFDDQSARRIEPLHLDAGDTLRVTCHHSQELRDLLPAFDGTQEKYVVWGEGTTDEMCLGILQVVFDDE